MIITSGDTDCLPMFRATRHYSEYRLRVIASLSATLPTITLLYPKITVFAEIFILHKSNNPDI